MTRTRQAGLYQRLVTRLLLPMLVLVAAGGGLGMYAASRLTSEVFDRWLLDEAVPVGKQVSAQGKAIAVDLPQSTQAMLTYDEIDKTFFAVENHGHLIVGTAGIPTSGNNEAVYANGRAFDALLEGLPIRVALVHPACAGCGDVIVTVAETRLKRERAERRMRWFFSPMLLILAVTMIAIVTTVRRTVQPLKELADQWNRESHESLRPIPPGDLPHELASFSTALNDLLSRIRQILLRERRFAATAAHQLRTPLASLRLGLDRAHRAPDIEATRQILRDLDQSTEHTARLVQQLLLLGRLDPEQDASIDLQPVDLKETMRDVCQVIADLAFAKGVEVELHEADEDVIVLAQPELLAEAVANLLDNAINASSAGGMVQISVLASPPRFEVCDKGPGIPVSERETVFEHFARGSQSAWAGSGLGLAIVRDVARLHRANVRLADAPHGSGLCVQFEFDSRPIEH